MFSSVADAVDLCLFDAAGTEDATRRSSRRGLHLARPRRRARATARATATASTDRDPASGALQPGEAAARPVRARRSTARCSWDAAVNGDDDRDSAPYVPRSVVGRDAFDWGDDRPPATRAGRLGHLRAARQGLHDAATRRSPRSCAAPTRASAHPAAIDHLLELGVTAVELLPVHSSSTTGSLAERGLRNYWGYQSIGFFAPHNELRLGGRRRRSDRGVQARWSRRCTRPASR